MQTSDPWHALDAELNLWRAEGRVARLWLRDDDAVAPSAALDRLLGVSEQFRIPLLLAVIPAGAHPALADRLARAAEVLPCQHGFSHRNHAPKGQKAAELGDHRPLETILTELAEGRQRLLDLFGERLPGVLVPPWNRITPKILPSLPALGLTALSTFGWRKIDTEASVRQVNCHVDIIDWKGTRRGHTPTKLCGDLVEALAQARAVDGAPIGILTHHLVHDAGAWSLLETLFARTQGAARWVNFNHCAN